MYFSKFLRVAAVGLCTSVLASGQGGVGDVVGGLVTSISSDSITINSSSVEKTLSVNFETQVAGTATSLSEVTVGSEVAVRCNAEGNAALLIRVIPPPDEVVSGSVVSISENSLTLKTLNGEETFAVNDSTLVKNAASVGDIKAGDRIAIRISSDRKNTTLINAKPPQ